MRQCGTIKLLNQNDINVRRLPEPFRLPHLCRPSTSFSLRLIFCNSIMQNDAGSIQHELPSAVNKHIVHIDEELAYYHTENKYRRSSHTRYPIVFLLVVSGFLLCLTTRDHSRYPLLSKLSPWRSTSKTSEATTLFPSLPLMMEGASEFDWETVSRSIYLSF